MKSETKEILLSCDEKDAIEFPSEFNAEDLEKRARKVYDELCASFGKLEFEDWQHNQDASFGLAIIFKPYENTVSTYVCQPVVRFSNFGNLATFTREKLLPDDATETIKRSLHRHGFIYISEEDLASPYDGIMSPCESIPNWWIRYFDWV